MSTTLFVAMITYDGVIDLPLLQQQKTFNKHILDVKPSNMNKNKDILTSIIVELTLENIPKVSVHFYAPRIKIMANKYINEINSIILKLLKKAEAKFVINMKKTEIIITFYMFGVYNSIQELENYLMTDIEPEYSNNLKSVDSFFMKGHIKGTKSAEKVKQVNMLIEHIFKDSVCSKEVLLKASYYSLSNASYSINKHIAIYELATKIKQVNGFENALVLYNNIKNANMVTITIPLLKTTDDLWRKDIECTYTIRSVGIITQSTPSSEYESECRNLLLRALKQLEDEIIRPPFKVDTENVV